MKGATEKLSDWIEQIRLIDPDFVQLAEMKDLDEQEIEPREYPRPAGYAATTRCHMGRLCVPVLNDSGATCSCITEEQMLLLINHVQKMQTENLLTIKDYNFPLRKISRYKNVASLKGAEASGRMEVEFAAIIRVEFIPCLLYTSPSPRDS